MHGRHLLAIVLVAAVPLTALAALQGPGAEGVGPLLGAPAPETGDPPTFVVRWFGNAFAQEPTLTYRGSEVYFSGMDPQDGEGNLWFAANDTSNFTQVPDPPTTGGIDAVVHFGEGNLLFFAEQSEVEVATWNGSNWSAIMTPGLIDRPWFATHGGQTYLAGNGDGAEGFNVTTRVFEWDGAAFAEVPGSPLQDGRFAVVDFIIAPNGRLYVLVVNSQDGSGKAFVRSGGAWSETGTFNRGMEPSFGIPRLAADAASNVYLAYAHQGADRPGVALRKLAGTSWTDPVYVSADGVTGAMPAIVGGSAGKVGIAWYEAEGEAAPSNLNATWRVMYAVVTGADSTPAVAHRVTAAADVHMGKLYHGSAGVGDFLYAILRDGDAQGKVAIAFARDGHPPPPPPPPPLTACLPLPCPHPQPDPPPPWPGFAYQDSGEGLL